MTYMSNGDVVNETEGGGDQVQHSVPLTLIKTQTPMRFHNDAKAITLTCICQRGKGMKEKEHLFSAQRGGVLVVTWNKYWQMFRRC